MGRFALASTHLAKLLKAFCPSASSSVEWERTLVPTDGGAVGIKYRDACGALGWQSVLSKYDMTAHGRLSLPSLSGMFS